MTEIVTEKAVCANCNAEIRDESLFCYNCGSSVAPPPATVAPAVPEAQSKVETKRPQLKTAASLRKHRRAYNRQPVEISWEPRDNSAGVFILATIVLSTAALVLLLLALYLR